MPVIDIFDDTGRLLPDARHHLWALLTWPNDAQRRARDAAVWALAEAADGDGDVIIPATVLRYVLVAPSMAELAPARAVQQAKGEIVGDLVLRLVALDRIDRQHASLRKVMRLYEREKSRAKIDDGRPVPCSVANLKRLWQQFRNVSHLWAAVRSMQVDQIDDVFVIEILRRGKFYFDRLTNHLTPVGRAGTSSRRDALIQPGTAWCAPESVDLPPLTTDEIARLEAFQPGPRFREFMTETPAQ